MTSRVEKRSAARLGAVQALYQMEMSGAGTADVFAEFESHWLGQEIEGDTYKPADADFFKDIVGGVVRDQAKLDPMVNEALSEGWPLKRVEAMLRAVLRAGAYELTARLDVPSKVVVSEYVDVAHAFLDREEAAMTNAVLDRIARETRADLTE